MSEPKPLSAFQQTYHWRNKNCGPWSHDWVKKSLPGLAVSSEDVSAEIVSVSSVSGDCDLGQRKGKLLTIYDLEVEAEWTGKDKDGEEVKGTVKILEFSHEAIDGLSDYVFQFSLSSSSNSSSENVLAAVRKLFPPVLTEKLNSFREELLTAHGVFIDGFNQQGGSGTSTPASGSYTPAPPTKAPEAAATPVKEEKKKVASTAVVEVSADLQASADDLWGLLTDSNKIPMWSRSPAKMNLAVGSPFELFDNNIRGKIVSSDPPKQLVQSWQPKNPNWPTDHYATMTMTLVQGSDSTSLKFKLDGVPTGQESDIERALDTFYIRGLKQMGLGALL